MAITVSWKNVTSLSNEEFQKKLESESIIDKFSAIGHEVKNEKLPIKYAFLRFMAYLEWFFDKVIEKKVQDKVARKKLQDFTFVRKMDLMKDWELLLDANFRDVDRLRIIRNESAHNLTWNEDKILQKLNELERYREEQFKDLDPIDRCIAIVIDIMSVFTNALNTNFAFKPTPQKNNPENS